MRVVFVAGQSYSLEWSVNRHVKIVLFKKSFYINVIYCDDVHLSSAGLMAKVDHENATINFSDIKPIYIVISSVNEVAVSNMYLIFGETMCIHKIVFVKCLKFDHLFTSSVIQSQWVKEDCSFFKFIFWVVWSVC